MDAHGSDAEGTLAGRRHHELPSTLGHTPSTFTRHDSADGDSLRNRKLRVVNETRERINSDSVLADQDSPSTMPLGWSNVDFLEDKDRKARWRDSIDSKDRRTGALPSTIHDRTVEILVKLRLLPIMKALQDPKDKGGLKEALRRAETVLDFAVKEYATSALQGRCCYYIGVAMYLLDDDEAAQYFISALDAKGVYEEGRWAQQWTNHYDNIGELSPNRIAESERPVSWASSIGYLEDRGGENKGYGGSSHSLRYGGKQKPKRLGEGIQPTTPVSHRFSLDIQNDDPFKSGTYDGSDTPGSKAGSSRVSGESIASFSSWGSSPSKAMTSSRPVQDDDGVHSPKSTHASPTQGFGKRGASQSLDTDIDPLQPSPVLPRPIIFDSTTLGAHADTPERLSDSRPKSSRFRVNPPSVLAREQPPSPDTESEQELY